MRGSSSDPARLSVSMAESAPASMSLLLRWTDALYDVLLEKVAHFAEFDGMLLLAYCPSSPSDRNTSAVCHCHELRTFAPLGLAHSSAPFFADTKVASTKHSLKSSLPRHRRSSANASSSRRSTPARTHSWKRRWHVWYGGKRAGKSRQRAPERNIHKMPFNTSPSSGLGLRRRSHHMCKCGEASDKKLKGEERKKIMSSCLKG